MIAMVAGLFLIRMGRRVVGGGRAAVMITLGLLGIRAAPRCMRILVRIVAVVVVGSGAGVGGVNGGELVGLWKQGAGSFLMW